MGLTYTELRVTNLFDKTKCITVRPLVDTGAMFLCLPAAIAVQLGFDIEEVNHVEVTLADGRQKHVPRIGPIEMAFDTAAGIRTCMGEALVLGDEPLLGVLPLEAMDLVVNPREQKVTPHPDRPNVPVFYVK
jgi:clan AA aspartic protease